MEKFTAILQVIWAILKKFWYIPVAIIGLFLAYKLFFGKKTIRNYRK